MADNQTVETIKAVGAIVTPIILAWIAYLQIRGNKKQDVIHAQINGMQEKLIVAEKSASKEIGKEEGRLQQRAEVKEDSVTPSGVVDVKIVDQDKEVKVIVEKPKN